MLGFASQADLLAALVHCSREDVVATLHEHMLTPLAHVMAALQDPMLVDPNAEPELVSWPGGPLVLNFSKRQLEMAEVWASFGVKQRHCQNKSAWSVKEAAKLEGLYTREEVERAQRLRQICAEAWLDREPVPVNNALEPRFTKVMVVACCTTMLWCCVLITLLLCIVCL